MGTNQKVDCARAPNHRKESPADVFLLMMAAGEYGRIQRMAERHYRRQGLDDELAEDLSIDVAQSVLGSLQTVLERDRHPRTLEGIRHMARNEARRAIRRVEGRIRRLNRERADGATTAGQEDGHEDARPRDGGERFLLEAETLARVVKMGLDLFRPTSGQ